MKTDSKRNMDKPAAWRVERARKASAARWAKATAKDRAETGKMLALARKAVG